MSMIIVPVGFATPTTSTGSWFMAGTLQFTGGTVFTNSAQHIGTGTRVGYSSSAIGLTLGPGIILGPGFTAALSSGGSVTAHLTLYDNGGDSGATPSSGTLTQFFLHLSGFTPPGAVLGCTDSTATNYNALATLDDGSCLYASAPTPVPGCTNPAATNYNPLATVDNGSCVFPVVTVGCTDPRATNYNPTATVDNGSCVLPALPVRGCTDPTAINYNSLAAQSDGSCLYAVPVPTTTPPFVTVCPCLWTATLLPIKAWAIVVPPVGTWIQKPC